MCALCYLVHTLIIPVFTTVNARKGGSLVVHGWVMAEELVKLGAR